MRILLVEDDESIREVFKMMLEIEASIPGLEIETASDGAQALQIARHSAPDLVLLDLSLPEKDGFEVFRELRKLENCRNVKIVAVSAHNQKESIDRAIAMGFLDYVTKPIDFENVLMPLLRKIDGNSHRQAA